MSDRPDGCYRWVIFDPDCAPEIAYWYAGSWHLRGDVDEARVHKVGIGGTLDAPPDVWVDDLPAPQTRKWVQVQADPNRWVWRLDPLVNVTIYAPNGPERPSSYGEDDLPAREPVVQTFSPGTVDGIVRNNAILSHAYGTDDPDAL